ncbi:MAG: hypothetical protein LUQ65_03030 [Candidatus Helarchaeota archaeon]|nr:hypothetical protein [Candidatus Helarchaeota archaeon]
MMELITNNLLPIIILGSLVLILPNIYFLRRNRSEMKPYYQQIETLIPHFSGRVSKLQQFVKDEPRLIGQYAGHKFSLTYYRPEGLPPNILQLKCYITSSVGLRIFAHSIPSRVLFDKKVVTDDPDLDRYDFYSNKPVEAKHYLTSRKTIFKQLIDSDWGIPDIGRRSITTSTDVNRSIDPETIEAALKKLIELRN